MRHGYQDVKMGSTGGEEERGLSFSPSRDGSTLPLLLLLLLLLPFYSLMILLRMKGSWKLDRNFIDTTLLCITYFNDTIWVIFLQLITWYYHLFG